MYKTKQCTKCKSNKFITAFYCSGRPNKGDGLRQRCIDCLKVDRKEYCQKNKDKRSEYQKKYQPVATKRMRQRYQSDATFRLMRLLRSRVRDAMRAQGVFKRKGLSLLGCSLPEYKEYIGGLFTPGMSWNLLESGEIHIDHIVPCSFFNLGDERAQKKCFHFSNTRPMWKTDNLVKSKRVNIKDVDRIDSIQGLIRSDINILIQQNVQS